MKPNCDRCKNDPSYYNAMLEICNPCIFDGEEPKQKKMTNADRIRSMTDEELAEFISDIKLRAFKYFGHTGDYDEIVESNLEWLKQEAE